VDATHTCEQIANLGEVPRLSQHSAFILPHRRRGAPQPSFYACTYSASDGCLSSRLLTYNDRRLMCSREWSCVRGLPRKLPYCPPNS
jgi:hypothetical protein